MYKRKTASLARLAEFTEIVKFQGIKWQEPFLSKPKPQTAKHPITASAKCKGEATGWWASASERKQWGRMPLAFVGLLVVRP